MIANVCTMIYHVGDPPSAHGIGRDDDEAYDGSTEERRLEGHISTILRLYFGHISAMLRLYLDHM